jgi:T5SS/PEP-CTERM-associated repeat protein
MKYLPALCVAKSARSKSFVLALVASLLMALLLASARADIAATGNVIPSDPSTWTSDTGSTIGRTSAGTVTVDGGSDLLSLHCYLGYESTASGLVTISGTGSTWNIDNFVHVGYMGSGTLNVVSGAIVSSDIANIGSSIGSSGAVTVDGAGSTWNNGGHLFVGTAGSGTLRITDGGTVNSSITHICGVTGSSGTATVDGVGSNWTASGGLSVGGAGPGILSITGGGNVTTTNALISSTSLLAIDVGRGSSLSLGASTSTLANNGIFRMLAGAGVPVNDNVMYPPITTGTWGGTGTFQAVGGRWFFVPAPPLPGSSGWDGPRFVASSVTPGTSGLPVAIDRALVQRVLISDEGTERTVWSVGASFPTATGTATMTFTASAISEMTLGGNEVLGGWTFATTGYDVTASNPIYLSFDVGAGHPADGLRLWHYDGSNWATFSPFDLTYDGRYASFTVTGLSGYAVTVPEPGMLGLLSVGVLGLFVRACRRRGRR